MLTYTLLSSVKFSINGSSFTDIYMKFRNAYMLISRTPGISTAHLFKSRDLSESSKMCSVFLIGGKRAASHPIAFVFQRECCRSLCSGGGC